VWCVVAPSGAHGRVTRATNPSREDSEADWLEDAQPAQPSLRYSAGGLSISLPLPHTATHPRKPTVLVRDLSTREVAVKWIAHFSSFGFRALRRPTASPAASMRGLAETLALRGEPTEGKRIENLLCPLRPRAANPHRGSATSHRVPGRVTFPMCPRPLTGHKGPTMLMV
jgi:hypothetical protein